MTKEERTNQIRMRVLLTFTALILLVLIVFRNKEPVEFYELNDNKAEYVINIVSKDNVKLEHVEHVYEVDPAERELLAHVIYAEAGGCSTQAQYYVGSVVLNRINDSYYPDTMTEVVYQTEPTIQYGCTYDGNIDKEPSSEAYEIADKLLRYGSVVPKEVVFQSEYTQGSGIWKHIDGIYFCYK